MYAKYGRSEEINAFEDSKLDVKGLVDSGVTKIPQFFVTHSDDRRVSAGPNLGSGDGVEVPVIDLKEMNGTSGVRRSEIVEEIRKASETWGAFQVVNHGIAQDVLDEMIRGVREFMELSDEVTKEFYSRESMKKVKYYSNVNLEQAKGANWRDTLACIMAPNPPLEDEIPLVCRYIYIYLS